MLKHISSIQENLAPQVQYTTQKKKKKNKAKKEGQKRAEQAVNRT